jgi:topoisomerase (DNA) II binding protein 1
MVRRGGADAGGHGAEGCTHVVVCGLVYVSSTIPGLHFLRSSGGLVGGLAFIVELKWMQDDPVCAAARRDGKKVVTQLWVDDSLDAGAMADADRVSPAIVLASLSQLALFSCSVLPL